MNSSENPYVSLQNVMKSYGDKLVLQDLSLDIYPAEMVSLLGPSGCGKSTALKVLSGLEMADSGDVLINGRSVVSLPTRKRNLGMVFQAYSLFPHLNAIDNIAYGLKIRGVDTHKRRARAGELLELVGLNEHGSKFPNQLSGGQQQRVALARALAVEPDVLLLDEPLSALDAKVRDQLRDEIRRVQLQEGIACLMVTHDQEEALVMSDRIGVMNNGAIEQIGTPAQLYRTPETPFISSFVGATNRMPGVIRGNAVTINGSVVTSRNTLPGVHDGDVVVALIRPEEMTIEEFSLHDDWVVLDLQLRGLFTAVKLQHNSLSIPVRVDVHPQIADGLSVGQRVGLRVTCETTVTDIPSVEERQAAATMLDTATTHTSALNG